MVETIGTHSSWTGQSISQVLATPPDLQLSFYKFGVILRKMEQGRISEYPVDPKAVAAVLSETVTFDTGFLSNDVLMMRQSGTKRLVIEYRKPQITGLFLEGEMDAIRTPLPGMVMIAEIDGTKRKHHIYAVKSRPKSLKAKLYHAPLPHIYNNGTICWGTVPQADGHTLDGDWQLLLGSRFGNHATAGKSKQHRTDIRQLLKQLAENNAKRYPTSDMIDAKTTLEQVVKEVWK